MLFFLAFLLSCSSSPPSPEKIGNFRIEKDLFLAQFDVKTDVDDLHSVAGVATMLADPRFKNVRYHAVAGAYGTQIGLYVPGNELFEAAFGNNWSDAHADRAKALHEVTNLVSKTLQNGGEVWIADAGQSDFSSDIVRSIKKTLPKIATEQRIHVVQHSDWNESVTAPENLGYVKSNAMYHKIPDGNVVGNGSPGLNSEKVVKWRDRITDQKLVKIWETAIEIANRYNGQEERYHNPSIAKGGLDFSDVSETCWIFGFDHLVDAELFFKEFASQPNFSAR